MYINYSTEQFTSLVEQNKKQAEMISFLLERNKQLQDKLNDQMIDLKYICLFHTRLFQTNNFKTSTLF